MKRSVIDILDLSTQELEELVATAEDIIANPDKYAHACDRRILATLFFEPSTRTRMSFEAAMYELGGHVISVSSAMSSSAAMFAITSKFVREWFSTSACARRSRPFFRL